MSRPHRGVSVTVVCALSAAALLAAPAAASGAAPVQPLTEVAEALAGPSLVLNEIVYDDAQTGLADRIEIYNAGSEEVLLDGWKVSDEKRDVFGAAPAGTTLAPGEFLVLVKDVDFGFGLGKGDEVVLYGPDAAVVDSYAYANTAPLSVWARCPDGTGAWAHATAATPGAANDCSVPDAPGAIRINEVDSQPADWVEFHNPGSVAIDVSGYEIRDNSDDHRWTFLEGTSIPAQGYLLVEEGSIGLVNGVETAFRDPIGIGSADRIRLYDTTGALIDDTQAWSDHAAIGGDLAAATYARCRDGVGTFALAYPTPGATNSCVLPPVVINEIESNGDTTDWVEVLNTGSTTVDVSGWTIMDADPNGHASETTPLPAGTLLEPGAYLVFDQPANFVFGLGNGDTVTIRDANGTTVAEHLYGAHAAGVLARCADGTGAFVDIAVSTKGMRNACGVPVRINEVESDGGSPGDWIELVNPTASALDVSGLVVKDDDDTHAYAIPVGTTIAAGGHLVIEQSALGFGLGADDRVRVFDGDLLVDETAWGTDHAGTTWGRCPEATGAFAVTAGSTKGEPNTCTGEMVTTPWPGSAEVRVLDETPTFLEDSSGLDVQETAEGAFLWTVDNGEGRIWKLAAESDGTVSPADGWADGKRVRFQKDAGDPGAAGPDTEGITVDGDGLVYVASERDNSIKGVNQNVVLQVDPDAAAGDLVAQREWDLTALLPAVGANLGMEAVQWVPDSALDGVLFDDNTGAAYDPERYAGHGAGLFFVAVEDNGHVYAFALAGDGGATLVSEIAPGLPAVMALDYDSVRGVLWAVCDEGCDGRSTEITLNGTARPGLTHHERPAGMPNINNEGFATAPASLSVDGKRPVWWFADGFPSQALRVGTLPGPAVGAPGVGVPPLPGTALVDDNRNGVTINPAAAAPGERVTVSLDARLAGTGVSVWLYSDPVRVATGTLDAAGRISATIPSAVAAGAHRVAVFDAEGVLLGWGDLRVTAGGGAADGDLAATGTELPAAVIALATMLLLAGGLIVRRRRLRV